MTVYKDTAPENFAWASIDRALEFSNSLSRVMISTNAKDNNLDTDIEKVVNERVGSVLQVLHEFSPVKLATLWKLKARAQHGSLIATTKQYENELDPTDDDECREYVCGFHESHLSIILDKYKGKLQSKGGSVQRGIVHFENIADLSPRNSFVPMEYLRSRGLKKMVAVPFWRSHLGIASDGEFPNYLLNMYFSEYESASVCTNVPPEFFDAIQSKLISGIRALIDHRLVGITRAISNVAVSNGSADAGSAMDSAIKRVLPKYIMCERIIRLEQTGNGSIRNSTNFVIDHQNQAQRQARLCRTTEELLLELIEDVLDPTDNHHPSATLISGVKIAQRSTIESYLRNTELGEINSLIVGKIQNRGQPEMPRGFIILANRLNEFSTMRRPSSRIQDFFDWEDESYLEHVCSFLDFIAELFTGEEARMERVHILAHEMHAPTGFIYSTAERIHQSLSGNRNMPDAMKRRELKDILDANDLQTALIDNLMFGLRSGNQPPSKFYRPTKTDLNDVAEAVGRMVKPMCRRHKVEFTNIKMRIFPELIIDKRAATQFFLNMVSNAIKYHDPNKEFRFSAYSERISVKELTPTNAPRKFLEKLSKIGVNWGHLLQFEDNGIGVPKGYENRIFRPGVRANVEEVLEVQGAGLGLAVVRTIAMDHFGQVWLEIRRSPTTFCLFLPDLLNTYNYQKRQEWNSEAV